MRPGPATLRTRALRHAAALVVPGALAAAALTTAAFQIDRAAAATTAWLGWTVAGALGLLALAGAGAGRVAAAALAAGGALVALPHAGILRPAVVSALVFAAVPALAADALRRRAGGPLPARLGTWLGVALAAQVALRSDLLWRAPTAPASLAALLLWPAVAAAALAALAAVRPALARVAALVAFLAGPGFTFAAAAALALAALLCRGPLARRPRAATLAATLAPALPLVLGAEPEWVAVAVAGIAILAAATADGEPRETPRRGDPALAAWALATLVALAIGAGATASLPWLRERPAASFLAAIAGPFTTVAARPIERQPVVIAAATPRWEAALDGTPVSHIVVDSYLTNSAALACGTVVARLRLAPEDGPPGAGAALALGRDTAEWAAERPDVAAALACPAPAPWSSWTPAQGRFLGHHYRARLALETPVAARRLVIERSEGLPREVGLALFHVALER